jgi:hypothetical protein
MKIGIILIATNSYIVLAVRFIKRFVHFYKGDAEITFYIFTDEDPSIYLPDNINVVFIETHHKNWVEGTDSKFSSIISIEDKLLNEDYVLYVDSDTNIDKDFNEDWFIGESVGGQHYGDQGHMLTQGRPFERNPRSMAYIPRDTKLTETYYYGAFFCFSSKKMIEFCKLMKSWQVADKQWGYEPGVNDESFLNKEFHFNPPEKVVLCRDFKFLISDKGGIGDPRHMDLDVEELKRGLKEAKDKLINIQHGKLIVYE